MIDSSLLVVGQHDERKREPRSELEDFKIHGDDDDWMIHIGLNLEPSDKTQLKILIEQYKDIFAWTPADMPRIDISVSCYKLSIDKSAKPVQQKKRNHGIERQKAIKEKVKSCYK